MCGKMSAAITEHAEELATLLTQEQGKPLNGAGSRFELGGAAAWAGFTATLSLPDKVIRDDESARIVQTRKPDWCRRFHYALELAADDCDLARGARDSSG